MGKMMRLILSMTAFLIVACAPVASTPLSEIPAPTLTVTPLEATPSPPPALPTPMPTPSGPLVKFGEGTYRVGVDIAPGLYRTTNNAHCYWERLKGFSGTIDDVITNDNPPVGPVVLTILPSDTGFQSRGCGTWVRMGAPPAETSLLVPTATPTVRPLEATSSPPAAIRAPWVGDGRHIVGQGIQPGAWMPVEARGTSGYVFPQGCQWARLARRLYSDNAEIVSVIQSSVPEGRPPVVGVAETDYAFKTFGCGEWVKVGQ